MSGLVDVGALVRVMLIALVGGVGVVTLFSGGIVNAAAYADRRRGGVAVAHLVGAAICLLACAVVIAAGVWAMLDK